MSDTKKKTVTVDVTIRYQIEIDEQNEIVKEYSNQGELLQDLASYRFSKVLPVMDNGVKVLDVSTVGWSFAK